MSLLKSRSTYKPFDYPWAYDAWKLQQQMHWIADEVPMADDVKDWKNVLTEPEKQLCTQIFRFFTQADIEVHDCYIEKYLEKFKPNEVKMMLSAFANIETVHQDAYSHLISTLGMPDEIYQEFLNYKEMKDKYEYMHTFQTDTTEHLALTMAGFGAFTEGLQLFASFAILLNFQRFGKMKGMGQIIAWSVRDECYSDDTEILTTSGWKLFSDLTQDDIVAQFDKDTKEITFVKPKKVVSYDVDKEMAVLDDPGRPINFMVTPHHRTLTYIDDKPIVTEAQDLKIGNKRYLPTSGYAKGNASKKFTSLDKLLIAIESDGWKGVSLCTKNMAIIISTRGEKKTNLLKEILRDCNIEHKITMNNYGEYLFTFEISNNSYLYTYNAEYKVLCKYGVSFTDLFKIEDITSDWADKFMHFLIEWDGHVREERIFYDTPITKNADMVQAIATLGGWSTYNKSNYWDDRKGTGLKIHRIRLWKKDKLILDKKQKIKYVPYKGKVWCVEVETGFLVVRRNNKVCISGNTLHTDSIIRLFHTLITENPEIWTSKMREEIYNICSKVVYYEDAFVDLAFGIQGAVEGLTAEDVKKYIRYVADRRLVQLGLKPIYMIESNPLPWIDYILNGMEHVNFFENRVTEYTKAATTGTWEQAFAIHDKQ